MNRLILFLVISLCCCGPIATAHAQTPKRDSSEALRQLLNLPAPRPRNNEQRPVSEYPVTFFDLNNPPPDDAPLPDLVTYWSRWSHRQDLGLSDTVRQRLLEFCLDEPRLFDNLVNLLPQTKAAATKIKEVYDKAELTDRDRENMKSWLVFNSDFFLDELLAHVQNVKEDEKNGEIENIRALIALAKVNWETAEPLLRDLKASAPPRLAALAHSLFYQHAIDEKDSAAEEQYRKILKTIASNRELPPYARDLAIDKLSATEWSGRNEWYLELFQDETLIAPKDGVHTFSPLTTLCISNPDKWIPVMTRLVESKDLATRSAAAKCLISFDHQQARRDTLLPLLPWLSNPAWVVDKFGDRQRLIRSVGAVDIPESVPGLIWVVENDELSSGYYRSAAAQSLVKYKDPRAAPALKRALAKKNHESNLHNIVAGLIASQGLTDAEQLEALEAYATQLTSDEGRAEVQRYRSMEDEPLPIPLIIGKYLSELQVAPESLAQAVLTRAENLKSVNGPLATTLILVAHRWQGRQVDLDMITRIGNGSADAYTIEQALKRSATLRQNLTSELQGLASMSGMAPGIGAVLLENPSLAHDVLTSKDQLAQIALLACSRLTNNRLPVDLVGPLLRSKNESLALAAERYLLVEDSKEAQDLLWQHHPNKAFVTGWGENGEYVSESFKQVIQVEEKFRAELLKENGPLEIIALIPNAEDGVRHRVLRIFSDKAIYTHYEDPARYREREVSKAELASFKQFLSTKNYADLGPQFLPCHHNCIAEEFLTLTKEKGRRVYAEQGWELWTELRENLNRLGEGATLHYNLEKEIKGLEVLLADNDLTVRDVCQQAGETRILVHRELTAVEPGEGFGTQNDEDDSEAARIDRWRREVADRNAPFSWRVYAKNKAGAVTSQPDIYSTIDLDKFPPDDENNTVLDNGDDVQKLTADTIIIARNDDGLWKQLAGTKPVRVSNEDAHYSKPIATADGKWVVVARRDGDWKKPSYIVRFNMRTGREFRVNLEHANEFIPIAFVVTQGKVLLRRAQYDYLSAKQVVGPDRPEHYLLDPSTGDARLVTGEFTPLYEKGKRFLQPTDQPNEFWAAIPDENKKQTQVGRYNVKDFTFKSLLTVPHISFESLSMWVDERQKKLYVIYRGQLLRLPLS